MDWVNDLKSALAAEYGDRPVICALASVDDSGRARVRSLVCRRVEASGEMVFASDARSEKNDQCRDRPAVEVLFYLAGARLQYRVAGEMAVVRAGLAGAADALREAVWRELSDQTRAMFFWPPPGQPLEEPAGFERAVAAGVEPPATFELLVLRPVAVDVLDLNPHPHARRLIERDGDQWQPRWVNP